MFVIVSGEHLEIIHEEKVSKGYPEEGISGRNLFRNIMENRKIQVLIKDVPLMRISGNCLKKKRI